MALSGTIAIVHMTANEMMAPTRYQPKIGHSTYCRHCTTRQPFEKNWMIENRIIPPAMPKTPDRNEEKMMVTPMMARTEGVIRGGWVGWRRAVPPSYLPLAG